MRAATEPPGRAGGARVVQLGKYYAPDVGGVETLTRDLAAGFAGAGLRSEVVVFGARACVADEGGVAVTRCPAAVHLLSQPIGLGWVARAARALRRADAVVLHAPNLLGTLVAILVRRAPLIVFWHSDVLDKGLAGRLVAPLEQAMLARASLIWVTSGAYARASIPLRRWLPKVSVLVPGIPDPAGDAPPEALDPGLAAFLGARRVVLAVGRLVPYKGFDGLIDAAARLGDGHAVLIVGEGPERAALAARIDRLGLGDRVRLAGRLGPGQLRAAFAAAHLFALTSNRRSEAFGLVQLEAMAHGLPVVATDVPGSGVGGVSGGGLGGLVPIGDAGALADAILRVAGGADRGMLGLRARARFEALFTLPRMVDDACADVGRVTAGRGPRRPEIGDPA